MIESNFIISSTFGSSGPLTLNAHAAKEPLRNFEYRKPVETFVPRCNHTNQMCSRTLHGAKVSSPWTWLKATRRMPPVVAQLGPVDMKRHPMEALELAESRPRRNVVRKRLSRQWRKRWQEGRVTAVVNRCGR